MKALYTFWRRLLLVYSKAKLLKETIISRFRRGPAAPVSGKTGGRMAPAGIY